MGKANPHWVGSDYGGWDLDDPVGDGNDDLVERCVKHREMVHQRGRSDGTKAGQAGLFEDQELACNNTKDCRGYHGCRRLLHPVRQEDTGQLVGIGPPGLNAKATDAYHYATNGRPLRKPP